MTRVGESSVNILFVPSPQVTGPMAVNGDGLSFEVEAKKLGDAPQPLFKLPHACLLFPFHRLVALNPFKMTFACRKCGIVVKFQTDLDRLGGSPG